MLRKKKKILSSAPNYFCQKSCWNVFFSFPNPIKLVSARLIAATETDIFQFDKQAKGKANKFRCGGYDVQELLDSDNEELTIDELKEMNEQEQEDIQDRMTV
ncbi:hypothetical protein TNCV_334291 [Trichonephila clavipes]|nr:hypothetical protein TNCV_334291 [Trichonephila clavipes]